MDFLRLLVSAFAFLALPSAVAAQCGGDFSAFKDGLVTEATTRDIPAAIAQQFLSRVQQDPSVLRSDRAQGVFERPFIDFSRRLISQNRIDTGRAQARQYATVFDPVERDYGLDRHVLLAFWAFETDYGAFQGDFNTANALVALAHDCRRPQLFRPQAFAAMQLFAQGDFDPARTTGAWAGEIGTVQMLPADILGHGVVGDGDGAVRLKGSAPEALLSGVRMLQHLGWSAGEPWFQEVTVPAAMDWSLSGITTKLPASNWRAMGARVRSGTLADLPASLILPQVHKGPAFLAYPNFDVYFEWNQSFSHVFTAAYFATHLAGAPVYNTGTSDPGLGPEQMKELQRKLQAQGYGVGKIHGILGAGTRSAVQAEQKRLGLPADAWPTLTLLKRL